MGKVEKCQISSICVCTVIFVLIFKKIRNYLLTNNNDSAILTV